MLTLCPYPAYRFSGIPWLGDIPAHWGVHRLGSVADMRVSNVDKQTKADELPVRLCNYVDVYKNDRITTNLPFMSATATPDEIERFRLEPGDVLITKDSEAWNDIGVPALVESSAKDLVSGYHLALLRPLHDGMNSSYLYRSLQSAGVTYQFHVAASGVTRYGLTHNDIKSVILPLPPSDEQTAIVRYLDHADELINRYISAKERLIALLDEQRQAVVHQAVTRGLNSEVRSKSSDIEWLGDVPEHWEPRALKTICRMKSGGGITAESIEENGNFPVYGGNGIRGYTRTFTHDGEFVLIGRQGALCGNVHVALGRFWASEHAVVASLAPNYDLNWFAGLLTSMNLNQYSIAAAQPGLSVERVMNLRVPVPTMAEQTAIGEYIAKTVGDANIAAAKALRQIELINEYRTRLIADAVTGQIDVRRSIVELPE